MYVLDAAVTVVVDVVVVVVGLFLFGADATVAAFLLLRVLPSAALWIYPGKGILNNSTIQCMIMPNIIPTNMPKV